MGERMKLVIENIDNRRYYLTVTNDDGVYIGVPEFADILVRKGIHNPLPIPKEFTSDEKESRVCSIGKSVIDNKWYGWSHRAMYGFEIGDSVKEGDCTAMSGYVEECRDKFPKTELPIGFIAKTDEDCKRMAIAFACSVR